MRANLPIDITIFVLFLVGFEPALTGNAVHEWLNLLFAGIVLLHLLLHGKWLEFMTRRLRRRMSFAYWSNYFLDWLLLIVFVMVVLSGLMISKSVLAAPGRVASPRSVWHELHSGCANFLLVLVGVHFALHWEWIVNACARCLAIPLRRQSGTRPAIGVLD